MPQSRWKDLLEQQGACPTSYKRWKRGPKQLWERLKEDDMAWILTELGPFLDKKKVVRFLATLGTLASCCSHCGNMRTNRIRRGEMEAVYCIAREALPAMCKKARSVWSHTEIIEALERSVA